MGDLYLYPGSKVLRNLLDIHDEDALDLAEAELSRANMMLLYEQGFSDFSAQGLQAIHKALFGDIYDWAGEFRLINIYKREEELAGRSIWYSDVIRATPHNNMLSKSREAARLRIAYSLPVLCARAT